MKGRTVALPRCDHMTHKLSLSRCATAAIAAALATFPPAVMAQDAATAGAPLAPTMTVTAPPVAPSPQIMLPTTQPAPTVQPLPQSAAATAPAETAPAQAPRRLAADRATTVVQRRAAPAVVATVATVPVAAATPAATAVLPGSATTASAVAVPPVVSPPPSITPAVEPTISPLELGLIGSAVAVVGLGVMALFMRRRRDVTGDGYDGYDGYDGDAPTTRDPLADMMAPRATVHPLPSALRGAPPSSGNHAEMVDVGPTAANPFLTRKNRLRRARFLDRLVQGQRDQDARALAGQRLMQSAQRAPERAYPQPTAAAD